MAIVGRGDISRAITDREGFIFFCAGCSNREPITLCNKQKEMRQILDSPRDQMFVYISTLSIYYSYSEYTRHKLHMEDVVKRNFNDYCIFRIGNITFGDNPNTLLNYFRNAIREDKPIKIENTYRYLIAEDELNHWTGLIPRWGKHEMNCTGSRFKVSDIVQLIKNGEL